MTIKKEKILKIVEFYASYMIVQIRCFGKIVKSRQTDFWKILHEA